MKRESVPQEKIDLAISELKSELEYRLNQKGNHTFASTHEILGIVDEEHDELKDAVRSNDMSEVEKELFDIAVAALYGISCIKNKSLDW